MGGISGGSGYANNKTRFLKDNGWNVVVIDSHGLKNAPVVLDNLKPFSENRFSELFYAPSLFTLSKVKKIISKMSSLIDISSGKIAVESNSVILSLWGELLARELKARHLVYIIGEAKKIDSQELFEFYKFKYDHEEIFSIKKEMFEILFSPYMKIADAEKHFWSANCIIPPQDIDFPALETLSRADFNIVIFGRYKGFFPSMIAELCKFASVHNDKSMNLIFFGVTALDQFKSRFSQAPNLSCHFFASQAPVPKSLFQRADVVIATSGCANIAFWQGAKTISMDVVTFRPIGLMGYTTVSTATAGPDDKEEQSLSQLLEDLLVEHKYTGPCVMERKPTEKGDAYQLTFADGPAHFWSGDVRNIRRDVKIPAGILRIAFRLGIEPLVSKLRYVFLNFDRGGFLPAR